jgi:hypothetical protein
MNTKIFKITAIVLLLAGGFSSCGKNKRSEFTDPIEIPITEYSLYGTGYWWTNTETGKVAIINTIVR